MASIDPRLNKPQREYAAFVIRTSEGRRESVAPEDAAAYLEQRQAVLNYLRSRGI